MKTFQDHKLELPDKIADNPSLLCDKVWRMENLYPIRNKRGILVPFKMNIFQAKIVKRLIENLQNEDYSPIVVLKARQVGISTLCIIYALDDVLFYEGRRSVILSSQQKSVDDIFRIARDCLLDIYPFTDHLEKKSIENSINDKSGEISLKSHGSFLTSRLEVRGLPGVNFIHYSEYAFTPVERLQATAGSLGPNAIKIVESTPYGMNHFHRFYEEAKEKNPQNTFFFPWYEHKEYRVKVGKAGVGQLTKEEAEEQKKYDLTPEQIQFWRHKQLELRSVDESFSSFKQEFAFDDVSCFATSGGGVIDADILMELKRQTDKVEPLERFWDGDTLIKVLKNLILKRLTMEGVRGGFLLVAMWQRG